MFEYCCYLIAGYCKDFIERSYMFITSRSKNNHSKLSQSPASLNIVKKIKLSLFGQCVLSPSTK